MDGGAEYDWFEDLTGNDVADGGTEGDICSSRIESRPNCEGEFDEQDNWSSSLPIVERRIARNPFDPAPAPQPAASSSGVRLGDPAGAEVTCDGQAATIVGTSRRDLILGTEGPDVIVALDGADVVYGLGGADVICGSGRADELFGGAGQDRLFGEGDGFEEDKPGRDELTGGPGDDLLDGGPAIDLARYDDAQGPVEGSLKDQVVTGRGTDQLSTIDGLYGSSFADLLLGGQDGPGRFGALYLFGSGGDDRLHGGIAYEYVNGGPGDDVATGGPGPDAVLGDFGNDDIAGGPGRDVVSDRFGNDVLRGGAGADAMEDYNDDNVFYGGAGDDEILGGSGYDVVHAGGHTIGDLCYQRLEETTGCDFSRTAL